MTERKTPEQEIREAEAEIRRAVDRLATAHRDLWDAWEQTHPEEATRRMVSVLTSNTSPSTNPVSNLIRWVDRTVAAERISRKRLNEGKITI